MHSYQEVLVTGIYVDILLPRLENISNVSIKKQEDNIYFFNKKQEK